jgi:riboflavin kinase/FMN adenylyltransferase
MQYIRAITDYQNTTPTVMTIGKFDGLHKGHQKLINEVKKVSENKQLSSIVFAFDMHSKQQIVTNQERHHLLNEQVDCFVECPFTEELHTMSAEEFVQKVLIDIFHVQYLVVGDDFRFGHGRKGTPQLLKEYEREGEFRVEILAKEKYQEKDISSTYIKEVIAKGDMELASTLLGYPYTLVGEVIHGRQLGRTIGVPTMNLLPAKEKHLPKRGVYFCKTYIDNESYSGICNIGVKPTIAGEEEETVEIHLLAYAKEIYGKEIVVEILKRERQERKFANLEALKQQIQKDIEQAKIYFE